MKEFIPIGTAAWAQMDEEEKTPWEQQYVSLCEKNGITPNNKTQKVKPIQLFILIMSSSVDHVV